jgi:soluble lytic murein transglycosylase-like protein
MMRRLITQFLVLSVVAVALVGLGGVSTMLAAGHPVARATSDSVTLAAVQAQLADSRRELERAHQILAYSGQYGIPADLSAQIYDIAIAEGIPASMGFQLVKVESDFQNSAQSNASAIGLTQLRVATARVYDARLDPSDLMNPDVNLRVGFRYLKDLMDRFGQNMPLALEAYNRGPTFVAAEQELGHDVMGRYSQAVMGGMRKKG